MACNEHPPVVLAGQKHTRDLLAVTASAITHLTIQALPCAVNGHRQLPPADLSFEAQLPCQLQQLPAGIGAVEGPHSCRHKAKLCELLPVLPFVPLAAAALVACDVVVKASCRVASGTIVVGMRYGCNVVMSGLCA